MSEFDRFVKAHRTQAPRPSGVSLTGALPVRYVRLGFGAACVLLVVVGLVVRPLEALAILAFPLALLWGGLEILQAADRMRAFGWGLIVGGLALVVLAMIWTAEENKVIRAVAHTQARRMEESSALPGVLAGVGMTALGVLILAIRRPATR